MMRCCVCAPNALLFYVLLFYVLLLYVLLLYVLLLYVSSQRMRAQVYAMWAGGGCVMRAQVCYGCIRGILSGHKRQVWRVTVV